ncbi:MAG: 2-oxoacid:acceptor oxidoreductase family protein [Clostridia bacterium]|nr:2-oxoacid:ferredoxin oxidoreductase subunit gamma [Ruminococcus sp.]MBO4949535.1 2-oxoacid:acceptor oxidoreductase family protein [Clostridia bacterium]MBQ7027069.1 2-oxoacid:acceptor oxidoreductase family protein [Ruminococcus sp.]MBQ8582118.1 2-oxoacid:acceptor oxidoreductase family protein [Ruminococcus sp.]
MTTEILLAGFGGQGILFAGKILAYCGLMDSKELSWLPSYGPEMRGGTCNCSVCISDDPIGSPLVLTPDILIALNQPSFDKFVSTVKPGGKVFFDSSMIENECTRTDIGIFGIPSQQLADDNALKGGSNIILLGKVLKETGICSLETMQKAIEKVVPASKSHLIPNNFKAIELGMNA